MKPYMKLDDYGRTTIRNLYYDTPNYNGNLKIQG